MVNIVNFLNEIFKRNIKISIDNEKVQFHLPKDDQLSDEEKQFIKNNKQAIINYINEDKTQIDSICALAPLQEGMLFHALDNPKSDQYHVQIVWDIFGDFDKQAFCLAWEYIIQQHEIFRTKFAWRAVNHPVQLIYKSIVFDLQELDWQALTDAKQREDIKILLNKDKNESFDFENGKLNRFYLVHLTPKKHAFIWSHHHILFDGWSLGLILKDLKSCYTAITKNNSFPDIKRTSYKKYIEWLSKQSKNTASEYWKKSLSNYADQSYPFINSKYLLSDDSSQYEKYTFPLSEEKITKYHNFAKQNKITLNILFQFAWAIILSKFNSTNDVIYGTVLSGRQDSLSQTNEIIGLFIKTIPVRVEFNSNVSIYEQLRKLQEYFQVSDQYSYLPLNEMAQLSGFTSLQLFNNLFVFQNYPEFNNNFWNENLVVEPNEEFTFEKTHYPLTIIVNIKKQSFIKVLFNTSAFSKKYIINLINYVQNTLDWIVNNSNEKISDYEILNQNEKAALLEFSNKRNIFYSGFESIQVIFEKQLPKIRNKIAIIHRGEEISYEELDRRTNQVARGIRKRYEEEIGERIKADTLIGISARPGIEQIVGILGILKSGGAYVPLDPDYPEARIGYIVEEAEIKLVVVGGGEEEELVGRIGKGIRLFKLSEEVLRGYSEEKVEIINKASDLAYVMYTSGSTGKPKGVMVEHQTIVNHLLGMQECFSFTASEKVIRQTPYSFDVSVTEIFMTLCFGAVLVIPDWKTKQDIEPLFKNMLGEEITVLYCVPSLLYAWIEYLKNKKIKVDSLHYIFCAGEALSIDLAEHCIEFLPKAKLYNLYGPTEATVYSSFAEYITSQIYSGINVPMGKPLPNIGLYVLGRQRQLLPTGVAGELYIGGAGLARGYLNREELTAERFIESPLLSEKEREEARELGRETRLYRTGDLVRWLEDGNLEFIGRVGHQVKLRGYRIELGEIESELLSYPNIQQALVVMKKQGEQSQLVAYYVEEEGKGVTV